MTAVAHDPLAPSAPSEDPPTPSWQLVLEELRALTPRQWWETLRSGWLGPIIALSLLFLEDGPRQHAWAFVFLTLGTALEMPGRFIEEALRTRAEEAGPGAAGARAALRARAMLSLPALSGAALVCGTMALALYALSFDLADRFGVAMTLFAAASLVATFVRASMAWRRLYDAAMDEATTASRARVEATMARLLALQSQMNPHFLFNTLNTIAALIRHDPAAAERTVGNLAGVLRRTMGRSEQLVTTVDDELAYVRAYLAIEEERWRDRLTIHWEIEEGAGDYSVPPFVLQPLIENALKHGLAEMIEGGTITVRIETRDGRLLLSVEDDGVGFPPRFTEGIGLGHVRQRVRFHAAAQGSVRVEPVERGARVVDSLPASRPARSETRVERGDDDHIATGGGA